MPAGSNRRKVIEATITVGSTASSGNTGESGSAASAECVSYFVKVGTATAGTMTLTIEVSPNDGTDWYALAAAEMVGQTGAISTTGNYRIRTAAGVPLGTKTRLVYTIVTGPFAFTVIPVYEKTAKVF